VDEAQSDPTWQCDSGLAESEAAWHKATRLRIVILLSLSSPNANSRQSHSFAWSADAYSQVRDWRAAICSKINAIPALLLR
jgi:hypothetical protein